MTFKKISLCTIVTLFFTTTVYSYYESSLPGKHIVIEDAYFETLYLLSPNISHVTIKNTNIGNLIISPSFFSASNVSIVNSDVELINWLPSELFILLFINIDSSDNYTVFAPIKTYAPTSTPTPTMPMPTITPSPTSTPTPTIPMPTITPSPTSTPTPTMPMPTITPSPTSTPTPTMPMPTITPSPTSTPTPTMPMPTITPSPTSTPTPTMPMPTITPSPTSTPTPTMPMPTITPVPIPPVPMPTAVPLEVLRQNAIDRINYSGDNIIDILRQEHELFYFDMYVYDSLILHDYANLKQRFEEDLIFKKGDGFTIQSFKEALNYLTNAYKVHILNSTNINHTNYIIKERPIANLNLISSNFGVYLQIDYDVVYNGYIIPNSPIIDYLENFMGTQRNIEILIFLRGLQNKTITMYRYEERFMQGNSPINTSITIGDWHRNDAVFPIVFTDTDLLFIITDNLNGNIVYSIFSTNIRVTVG
jgi:hypothetical protein